ncbi:MAG: hypothetical protein QXS42_03765 [Zestosphaera sp.]
MRKPLELRVERSRSRSNLHKRTSLYMVMSKNCDKANYTVVEKVGVRPAYAVGNAELHKVAVPEDSFAVQATFTLNPRNRVSGEIIVLDPEGRRLSRAVYRKLKVRVLEGGDPLTLKMLKCLFDSLKLLVKKYSVLHPVSRLGTPSKRYREVP